MLNSAQSKYFFIAGAIIVLVALLYVFGLRNSDTQISTPSGYEKGAKLMSFTDVPPGFPAEIILEGKVLDNSITLDPPRGSTQSKLSYKSDNGVAGVLKIYQEKLPELGWQVSVITNAKKVAVFSASKGEESVLITAAALNAEEGKENPGSLVTFQYEQ